ncbi:unnamed protein product [Chrysodeixis includens]|uniref:Uncharacterized protein n=1 Tax=Chrysodeixis includens TaxID=689277 RepID=A0A9N8PWW9_CHRIL|nr:unnamed protein product [Chrysodeixis includens]
MRATHRSHGPEPTAAVAYIGRNGKYISSRAKSPLHTPRVAGPERAFDSNEPWPPPHCRAQFYHRSSAARPMHGSARAAGVAGRVLAACCLQHAPPARRSYLLLSPPYLGDCETQFSDRARGGALINIYYRYFGNRGVSFGEGAEYTQLNEAGALASAAGRGLGAGRAQLTPFSSCISFTMFRYIL